jgi:CTP:molybdopterin cytidylyltransferase MocA
VAHADLVCHVEVANAGILVDIDTPQDLPDDATEPPPAPRHT